MVLGSGVGLWFRVVNLGSDLGDCLFWAVILSCGFRLIVWYVYFLCWPRWLYFSLCCVCCPPQCLRCAVSQLCLDFAVIAVVVVFAVLWFVSFCCGVFAVRMLRCVFRLVAVWWCFFCLYCFVFRFCVWLMVGCLLFDLTSSVLCFSYRYDTGFDVLVCLVCACFWRVRHLRLCGARWMNIQRWKSYTKPVYSANDRGITRSLRGWVSTKEILDVTADFGLFYWYIYNYAETSFTQMLPDHLILPSITQKQHLFIEGSSGQERATRT